MHFDLASPSRRVNARAPGTPYYPKSHRFLLDLLCPPKFRQSNATKQDPGKAVSSICDLFHPQFNQPNTPTWSVGEYSTSIIIE